ncbi:CPCC family cysteine-rich protein [Archangium gephyra]|uniref:CPCC family cysteine-rich protein n=1 Tax=Archangium gephyra TaxID=48 RepID=UPI0035D43546
MSAAYPCPCCGYRVFDEPLGSYSICPYCFWEDDALQLEFATTHAGGPNNVTLLQAQRNHLEAGLLAAATVSTRTWTRTPVRPPVGMRPLVPCREAGGSGQSAPPGGSRS